MMTTKKELVVSTNVPFRNKPKKEDDVTLAKAELNHVSPPEAKPQEDDVSLAKD
jgi:hypothetical protein